VLVSLAGPAVNVCWLSAQGFSSSIRGGEIKLTGTLAPFTLKGEILFCVDSEHLVGGVQHESRCHRSTDPHSSNDSSRMHGGPYLRYRRLHDAVLFVSSIISCWSWGTGSYGSRPSGAIGWARPSRVRAVVCRWTVG